MATASGSWSAGLAPIPRNGTSMNARFCRPYSVMVIGSAHRVAPIWQASEWQLAHVKARVSTVPSRPPSAMPSGKRRSEPGSGTMPSFAKPSPISSGKLSIRKRTKLAGTPTVPNPSQKNISLPQRSKAARLASPGAKFQLRSRAACGSPRKHQPTSLCSSTSSRSLETFTRPSLESI